MRFFFTITLFFLILTFHNASAQNDIQALGANQVQQVSADSFEFLGSYPNPVREYSYFKFKLSNPQQVSVQLFDLLGNQMKSLDEDFYSSGIHTVKMDVSDVKPGIYFYKVHIKGKTITERLNIVNQ
jgi:hypothetical protein